MRLPASSYAAGFRQERFLDRLRIGTIQCWHGRSASELAELSSIQAHYHFPRVSGILSPSGHRQGCNASLDCVNVAFEEAEQWRRPILS